MTCRVQTVWRRGTPPPPQRTWPPRSGRARVLIEDSDGASQWAVHNLLAGAGFDVATCDGPERLPRGECSLVTDGSCALAEGADVIVNSLSLEHEPSSAVLAALRSSVPATPVIVEVTRAQARRHHTHLEGCRVLTAPARSQQILAEVESAVREHGHPQPAEQPPVATGSGVNLGRLVAVCEYIALPFDTVTDILSRLDAEEVLTTALDAALEQRRSLLIQSSALEIYGRAARMRITCHTGDAPGFEPVDGAITVLVVTSGDQPVTELLVTASVGEENAPETAAVARRFLEELSRVVLEAGGA